MTREDVIKRIKRILEECKEDNEDDEIAVCYVTPYDADALGMAIKTLEQEPCDDIKEYYKDIWDCDINHPRYEDTVADIVEKSYMSGYVQGVENTAKEFRFELEQKPCEDAVSRQAVLNTLNKDSVLDEDRTVETYKELLIACYNDLPPVAPTEKQSQNVDE